MTNISYKAKMDCEKLTDYIEDEEEEKYCGGCGCLLDEDLDYGFFCQKCN